jgi:heptosyltransferase I
MADPRFLLVRLGSLGDIVHTLPAAAALRDTFSGARIDWVVDRKWSRLLEGNPDLTEVIALNRSSPASTAGVVRHLRANKYSCAVDFQALYKSALISFGSAAPRRIGFQSSYAREGLAALLYTERYNPSGPHKVDHNLTLVQAAGAKKTAPRFPLAIYPQDEQEAAGALSAAGLGEYFVLNPGGGWRSKCWPAERYGELHKKLAERHGWRGVVTFGPGEEALAQQLSTAAGQPAPVPMTPGFGPLLAVLRRANFIVSADTGPLHLAAALGTRAVGLYGPTDPARNGPYSSGDVIVRNSHFSETTYNRGASHSRAMLSITVEQVLDAVERRLGLRP